MIFIFSFTRNEIWIERYESDFTKMMKLIIWKISYNLRFRLSQQASGTSMCTHTGFMGQRKKYSIRDATNDSRRFMEYSWRVSRLFPPFVRLARRCDLLRYEQRDMVVATTRWEWASKTMQQQKLSIYTTWLTSPFNVFFQNISSQRVKNCKIKGWSRPTWYLL